MPTIDSEDWWEKCNINRFYIKLEKPKFIPYREKVIKSISRIIGVTEDQVFVKAKTGEKIYPVGTGDAIEATVCLKNKR